MYTEDQLLPISALQHLLFCERQCALIHVEGLWAENRLTVEGRHLHEKVHDGPDESRADVRIARGVPLRSLRLGLYGVADVVEFHTCDEDGTAHNPAGPFPVEYKRGRPKHHDADRVQLCAQAMCLAEMLGVDVSRGALFYGRTRRREDVAFDRGLRSVTERAAVRVRELLASGHTPPARREKKCDRCSLLHMCLPGAAARRASVAEYVRQAVAASDVST